MANLEEKIYEIVNSDKNSPLFVRLVQQKFKEEDYSGALEIIQKHIIRFTDYPTALLLYGETLAAVGYFKEAEENIKKAAGILNSEETYSYYLERINYFKSIHKPAEEEDSFLMDDESDELNVLAKELSGAKISSETEPESVEEKKEQIESEEEQKTEEPVQEEPKQSKPSSMFNFLGGGGDLVSETLAGIYFAQGNLKEAKSMYEKLISLEPEKEEHYRKKIKEIEETMEKKGEG